MDQSEIITNFQNNINVHLSDKTLSTNYRSQFTVKKIRAHKRGSDINSRKN